MIILIPSYEPDNKLLKLIDEIKENTDYDILVVNDGSKPEFDPVFEGVRERGVTILTHEVNRGKGEALKTGFKYIYENIPGCVGIVTADCDGQHKLKDINSVAILVKNNLNHLILGCRKFTGKVPFRNKFGNSFTIAFFHLATGTRVSDTQTGLRGVSYSMLPWLMSIKGSRFEYEQNMLLDAKRAGFEFLEIEIDTVYDEKHYSSHYRPIADSVRVMLPILRYLAASIISFFVDYILLLVFDSLINTLFISVILARIISATINYMLNNNLVFNDSSKKARTTSWKYALLAVVLVCLSYVFLRLFRDFIGIPLAVAKPMTDIILFCSSYWIQRRYVFN
ncbi:MAG: bifunctional glycosyltransferase family 2/GtrA family protein [Oscillospiraceae bacterium]|nr:bifunctional glycosyltransferase family 2/GtrA family protein [Oscillospiraceae bacterium]